MDMQSVFWLALLVVLLVIELADAGPDHHLVCGRGAGRVCFIFFQ